MTLREQISEEIYINNHITYDQRRCRKIADKILALIQEPSAEIKTLRHDIDWYKVKFENDGDTIKDLKEDIASLQAQNERYRKVLILANDYLDRNHKSGNFMGDDEHELWSEILDVLEIKKP